MFNSFKTEYIPPPTLPRPLPLSPNLTSASPREEYIESGTVWFLV